MTSSRNNHGYVWTCTALVLGCALSFTAIAQEKPRSLVPSFIENQTGGVPKTAPDTLFDKPLIDQVPKALGTNTDSKKPKSGDIVVEQLSAIHPVSIGVPGADGSNLGRDMWQGTTGKLAVNLLEKIKLPRHSPQMLDLYRRLIFTGASATGNNSEMDQLLDLRISKMISAGWIDAAQSLLERLPQVSQTVERKRYMSNVALLEGRAKDACALTANSQIGTSGVSYWRKLEIFCRVLEDNFDRAELGAALLEEQGEVDPLFFTLFAALMGDKVDLSAEKGPATALHFAMMKRLQNDIEMNIIGASGVGVQKTLMLEKGRANAASLQVALNLASVQGIDAAAFVADFKNDTVETADSDDVSNSTYQVLLAALKTAIDDQEKATYLLALWQSAAEAGDWTSVSALTLPTLVALPVGNYGPEFSFSAVQLLLSHGEQAKAQEWERAIRRAAFRGTPEQRLAARKDVAKIDTYVLLSGMKGIARWNAGSFTNWMTETSGDEGQADNAMFLLSMMEVFGYSVTAANWESLLYMDQKLAASNSNHALENTLVDAAVQGHVGKTVALSLLALGSEGPDKVSLTTLRAVTSALKKVGLVEEARQLAVEVAVLRGL